MLARPHAKVKEGAATVAFKLSVIRSMFDYLKSAGYVDRNAARGTIIDERFVLCQAFYSARSHASMFLRWR